MKIIHLISGYLGQGGAERLVVDLAEAQAEMGHDVAICTFRDKNERSLSVPQGVKYHSFGKKKGFSATLAFRIKSFLKTEKPDVVNCHLPAVFLYLIPSLLECENVNFFYTIHNKPSFEEPRKCIRELRSYFMKRKKLTFVAISGQIKKEFEDLYAASDIPYIDNGRKPISKSVEFDVVKREVESYKKNQETKVFVAVGRLFEQKNYPLMLSAFANLLDENVVLLVLGQGDARQYDAIKPNNVFFLGSKNNVQDYLLNADAFCMSSTFEGFPISIIEAFCASLPVLSTRVGGIPDAVQDGFNGLLCETNLDSYETMMRRFLAMDVNTQRQLGEMGRKDFNEKYDIRITAQKYLGLYNSILAQ